MSKYKTSFMNDDEKFEHYANISGFCKEHFVASYHVKVYEGAEILLYYFNEDKELRFETTLLCTNLFADSSGLKATLVDRKTYKIIRLGDVPNLVANGVVCHMPYRARLERTVKTTYSGRVIQGLTTTIQVHSESYPTNCEPHHVQAILSTRVHKYFSKEAIKQAEQHAMEG